MFFGILGRPERWQELLQEQNSATQEAKVELLPAERLDRRCGGLHLPSTACEEAHEALKGHSGEE